MKIYNEDKTEILEEYDLEKGYIKEDIIITHYEEVKAVEEQFHYETIAEYPNGGKEVEKVIDVESVEYKPARDEKEKILVYIPYTEEELLENKKTEFRLKREPLLVAFDIYKSNVSYGIEEDINRESILKWYKAILDLDEEAINNPPSEIRRYM